MQEAAALHHCAYRQSRAREHVRAASMKLVASRLLALESDLPASVFRCSSSVVWQVLPLALQALRILMVGGLVHPPASAEPMIAEASDHPILMFVLELSHLLL